MISLSKMLYNLYLDSSNSKQLKKNQFIQFCKLSLLKLNMQLPLKMKKLAFISKITVRLISSFTIRTDEALYTED